MYRLARFVRGLIVTASALLVLSHAAPFVGRAVASDPRTPPVEISMEPYAGELKQIRVSAGIGLPPFLFDTGGGATLVTPDAARSLGCEPYGRMTAFRHTGERIDVPECGPIPLDIAGYRIEPFVGVFDIGSLLPPDLPPLGGVLSLHTFRNHFLTMDLAGNRLTLENDESFARRVEGMRALHSRLSTEAGGEGLDLFVEVGAEKGSLWMLVDSGNLGPALLAPHALRQIGYAEWAEAAERSGGDPGTREIKLDLVGYGSVTVTARAFPGMIHDGMLNAELLRGMILAMDLSSGRAYARPAD